MQQLASVRCRYPYRNARILEHPIGIVVLKNRGFGGEQCAVETHPFGEVRHRYVDVESLHARFLLLIELIEASAAVGAHSVLQPRSDRTQQFSVRKSISWSICEKFAR